MTEQDDIHRGAERVKAEIQRQKALLGALRAALQKSLEQTAQNIQYVDSILSSLNLSEGLENSPVFLEWLRFASEYVVATTRGQQAPEAQPLRGPYEGLSVADAAERFFGENENRPAHVREIWVALAAGGIQLDSQRPLDTVNAILFRSRDRFEFLGSRTYRLKEKRSKG